MMPPSCARICASFGGGIIPPSITRRSGENRGLPSSSVEDGFPNPPKRMNSPKIHVNMTPPVGEGRGDLAGELTTLCQYLFSLCGVAE